MSTQAKQRAFTHAGALALTLLLAVGCGPGASKPAQTPATTAPGGKSDLLVGPEAMADGATVLGAWLAYGASKAALYVAHPPPRANQSADDFELELGARKDQSAFWSEQRKKGEPAHPAFDRQVEIWRAGFLSELVLLIHARPGWTVPSATIPTLRFEQFLKTFAGEYKEGAPVTVKPASGKVVPDVPGDDFPDPQRLPLGTGSCAQALQERQAAWTRWASLEPQLGGLPVAASDRVDFGHQLIAVRSDPAFAGRNVTWVSPRVAHLAMLDGFCAVEVKDWPRAVAMLTRAAMLSPRDPGPRLELSLALTTLKRHAEALRHADRALTLASEGCGAAMAWRRRGYILFELGALQAAREAYEKSLKLDPGSQIALSELATIAEEMSHGRGGAQGASFATPPPSRVVLTECRDGKSRPAAGTGTKP